MCVGYRAATRAAAGSWRLAGIVSLGKRVRVNPPGAVGSAVSDRGSKIVAPTLKFPPFIAGVGTELVKICPRLYRNPASSPKNKSLFFRIAPPTLPAH